MAKEIFISKILKKYIDLIKDAIEDQEVEISGTIVEQSSEIVTAIGNSGTKEIFISIPLDISNWESCDHAFYCTQKGKTLVLNKDNTGYNILSFISPGSGYVGIAIYIFQKGYSNVSSLPAGVAQFEIRRNGGDWEPFADIQELYSNGYTAPSEYLIRPIPVKAGEKTDIRIKLNEIENYLADPSDESKAAKIQFNNNICPAKLYFNIETDPADTINTITDPKISIGSSRKDASTYIPIRNW